MPSSLTSAGGGNYNDGGRSHAVVRSGRRRCLSPINAVIQNSSGADGMDRARHGRPPAAMGTKTKTKTEDRIVFPGTYHLLPPNNSTKPSAGGIINKP